MSTSVRPAHFLVIDVGNSRTKFGLFRRCSRLAGAQELPSCEASLSVPHGSPVDWEQLNLWGTPLVDQARRTIIAGVKPSAVHELIEHWGADVWPVPEVLTSPAAIPLSIDVDAPAKVGIDRLLNGVAANVIRPANTAAIVVDSGTATTVDYVSEQGSFAGGAILPGFALSARSLHEHTALLPLVTPEELTGELPHPRGRNTRDALRAGLYWGHVGAVRELVQRMSLPASPPPQLILTGGAAPLLLREFGPSARHEPTLSLQGLALIAETLPA